MTDETRSIVEYHKPTEDMVARITNVREAAGQLIDEIKLNCPKCADSSAAIRKVREALMTANASIVLEGRV